MCENSNKIWEGRVGGRGKGGFGLVGGVRVDVNGEVKLL